MQVSSGNSRVTHVFDFDSSHDEVLSQAIHVMTVLGKAGPKVDRLMGTVSGPIRKKAVPFRECHAELVLSKKEAMVSVFVSVWCIQDLEVNRTFAIDGLRQITTWLVSKNSGLKPVI
jgi:hypothetical protein